MSAHTRKLIGNIFLVLTIIFAITALNQGGLWWAILALSTAVTLWGIGTKSSHKGSL
ncbi:MAG: hypothetical protein SPI83_05570 [Rothia sp. (in: high G+C Gram-positive bacteria)]|nr:hypothetical protein [Rothia sp. (in: high G+C Gram-positive bacteria)]